MSKRERSGFGSEETSQESKKQRTDGLDTASLLDLANNADRLIQSLRDLKAWKENINNRTQPSSSPPPFQDEQLSVLRKVSQDVLPSLSALVEQSHTVTVAQSPQYIPLDSPWVSSEISDQLPPLPPINDPEIESQAFRHPSIAGQGPNYERLEWLGDAYIEVMSTCFILSTFPGLPSGRCAQIRERLVCNKQLARYFREYDLLPRAQIPSELLNPEKAAQGRSADKDIIKVQADIFEAYVGGIITADHSRGVQVVSQWLKAVWGRTIKPDVVSQEKKIRTAATPTQGQDQTTAHPKEILASTICVPGVQLKYEDVPCKRTQQGLPLYTVKITLYGYGEAGLMLGGGTALKKKEAGGKAAEQALNDNKRLIRGFRDRKRAYLEAKGDMDAAVQLTARTQFLDD